MDFLHKVFPNARFVYIIRDGRDAAYSYFKRDHEAFKSRYGIRTYLKRWNLFNTAAYRSCQRIGEKFCHTIRYEELVVDPEPHLRKLIKFLDLPWIDELLHHDELISKKKLSISKDPIYKKFPRGKISNSSVGKWRGNIAEFEDRSYLDEHAPMLKTLEYID